MNQFNNFARLPFWYICTVALDTIRLSLGRLIIMWMKFKAAADRKAGKLTVMSMTDNTHCVHQLVPNCSVKTEALGQAF